MVSKNILLITCSAGNGHMVATQNIKARLLEENVDANIITLEISHYIYPGGFSTNKFWDFNMRMASRAMVILPRIYYAIRYEFFYERLLRFPLEKKLKMIMENNPIDTVYDTQPLFTNLTANTLAKLSGNQTIHYHKILTDLPTQRTEHFLPGIKRAKFASNVIFKLHAPSPLTSNKNSEADFWKNECDLTADNIDRTYAFPVNPEYFSIPDNLKSIKINIPSRLCDYYELDYQHQTLIIPDNTFVTTLMLGSQGINIIPDYVDAYIAQAEKIQTTKPHIFFVACSKNTKLYQEIEDKIFKANLKLKLPQHKIIPLPMQTSSTIASLMWRSQQVIMRPGGLSCLEQLAMARTREKSGVNHSQKIWIHAPYNKSVPAFDSISKQDAYLLQKCFGWERGNAEYLVAHLDAHLTTPQNIQLL